MPALRRRPLDVLDRRDDRPRRIAHRAAAARAAVVEREHAHQPCSAAAIVAVATSSASRQLLRLAPAGLRERVAPAAAAADYRRGRLDDGARLDAALDQLRRHADEQVRAPVDGRAEHDRRVRALALQPIGEVEQRLRIGHLDNARQHRSLCDRHDATQQFIDIDRRRHRRLTRPRSCALSRAACAPARAPARPPATCSGRVRSVAATSPSTRSCSRSSATAAGPVSASIRRTFAALEVSAMILNGPISAVERTCVPPHSSRE